MPQHSSRPRDYRPTDGPAAAARPLHRRALLAVPALAASVAHAEDFPAPGRPVQVILPYPPGGGSDISARALAPLLERELGNPVIVVNRPGANSQIGLAQTAQARPDGYTLCYGLWPSTVTLILDPSRKAGFSRASFTPLAMHVIDPGSIIVRADSPLRSLADLVAAARARPGALSVSDPGILSSGAPRQPAIAAAERHLGEPDPLPGQRAGAGRAARGGDRRRPRRYRHRHGPEPRRCHAHAGGAGRDGKRVPASACRPRRPRAAAS